MKQKIVIKIRVHCNRCRAKAMEVTATEGVVSQELQGAESDLLCVIGTDIDSVCLVKRLRKKLGYARIVSVEEVKPVDNVKVMEDKKKKEEEEKEKCKKVVEEVLAGKEKKPPACSKPPCCRPCSPPPQPPPCPMQCPQTLLMYSEVDDPNHVGCTIL